MRIVLLFHVLFLFAFDLFAQRNYVPAVITTQQGDSLRGFVDYRNWNVSPSEIRFKTSLTDENDQHFGPGEIKGFRLAEPNATYISYQVKMDITRQDAQVLDRVMEREIQDTLVFLKVLTTTDNYNLYTYVDKHVRDHYLYDISGKAETMTVLEYVKAYVSNSAGNGIFEDKAYQKQLAELFKDCPAIKKHASRVSYSEIDMLNLFLGYDDCKHPSDKPFVKKKEENRFVFGLLAGFSANSYKFTGESYSTFKGATYSSSSSPLIGASMDILLGRKRRLFALHNELLYKEVKTSANGTQGATIKIGFSYLQLSTMIRYTYPKGIIRPFVNAGIANSIVISTKDNIQNRPALGITEAAVDEPRKHEESILAGAGVFVYRFSIEGRYATSSGYSPYAANRTNVNSFQLIAGYRF
jgi:hypothetical protein